MTWEELAKEIMKMPKHKRDRSVQKVERLFGAFQGYNSYESVKSFDTGDDPCLNFSSVSTSCTGPR